MKQLFFLTFISFLWVSTHGQSSSYCNGSLYLDEVFNSWVKDGNVTYGSGYAVNGNLKTLKMDIFQPSNDTNALRPLIIWCHGGSFTYGDKTIMNHYCKRDAKRGFVAASIDYRKWNKLQLPDSNEFLGVAQRAINDLRAAIRFFKNDAAGQNIYRIDTTNIFIGGHSSGAFMAMHVGYHNDLLEGPQYVTDTVIGLGGVEGDNSGNPGHISTDVAGVINLAGGLYRKSILDLGNKPPMFSAHGTADKTIPYESGLAVDLVFVDGSKAVHDHALNLGVHAQHYYFLGGNHLKPYLDPIVDDLYSQFLYDIICNNITSIENPQTQQMIMYPNPAADVVYFSHELNGELFDSFGRLLERFSERNFLELKHKPGIYFIKDVLTGNTFKLLIDK
ncbi:MAG: alpha/beta hydrolase fold domain-containing protein [Flavobacteriales bacterium]|nr:alpha/beta hydrolase fold domain-containing protein [Flavobacteriales bacterium]